MRIIVPFGIYSHFNTQNDLILSEIVTQLVRHYICLKLNY